jgi:hypothetical protein
MEIDLKQLDWRHLLRNSPLIDIGAKYRQAGSSTWFPVRPAFAIATKTYNQLGDTWLVDEWVATKYSEDWQTNERDWAIAQNGNIGYG